MTVKELKVIHEALWAACRIVENLACENYPHTEFEDDDFRRMFYELNDMCIMVSNKEEELQERKEQKA